MLLYLKEIFNKLVFFSNKFIILHIHCECDTKTNRIKNGFNDIIL